MFQFHLLRQARVLPATLSSNILDLQQVLGIRQQHEAMQQLAQVLYLELK